ncbi:MAG: DUF3592 domain-containing protein [Bacillota bacterium]|nr:DUF3592 domain-containing protein [Bacillota bacterium]
MLENPKLFIILIFSLIGIIFLMIGIGIRMNYKKKVKYCNVHTVAKVVDNIKERMQSDDSYSYSYFPVIQFYNHENEIKQRLSIGYSKELPIGSYLEIMYEENNPKRILVLENNPQKKLYIIFIIVGVASLMVGLIIGVF